ncbi:MAG: DUF2089 family protein [Planctomycetota bacterium]|nr:MAG: DUF2089 family protein [Planctomycetota bacterium]
MDAVETTPVRIFRRLEPAEQEFVLRLVLASGSLKELAAAYGVSYPTIRSRLDRLIERLRRLREGEAPDPLGELLARLVEQGQITIPAAQEVRRLCRRLASQEETS